MYIQLGAKCLQILDYTRTLYLSSYNLIFSIQETKLHFQFFVWLNSILLYIELLGRKSAHSAYIGEIDSFIFWILFVPLIISLNNAAKFLGNKTATTCR